VTCETACTRTHGALRAANKWVGRPGVCWTPRVRAPSIDDSRVRRFRDFVKFGGEYLVLKNTTVGTAQIDCYSLKLLNTQYSK
jgi:hypothetical protein